MLATFTYLLSLELNWKHFRKWNYSVFTSVSILQSTGRFYQKPFLKICVYQFFNRFKDLTKVHCSIQVTLSKNFNRFFFLHLSHGIELPTYIFNLKLVLCTYIISTSLLCGQIWIFKPFKTFPCLTHRLHIKWLTKD